MFLLVVEMGYTPIFCLCGAGLPRGGPCTVLVEVEVQQVQAELKALVEPVVEGLGFELWGVEYLAHGTNAKVNVYIDSPDGVDVDDCAAVSRQLSAQFDVEDLIQLRYTLEVSSPGMDRRLFTREQFRAFAGANIKVSLKSLYEGRKRFSGVLCGIEDDDVVVRCGDEEFLFPFEDIERARVVPSFE